MVLPWPLQDGWVLWAAWARARKVQCKKRDGQHRAASGYLLVTNWGKRHFLLLAQTDWADCWASSVWAEWLWGLILIASWTGFAVTEEINIWVYGEELSKLGWSRKIYPKCRWYYTMGSRQLERTEGSGTPAAIFLLTATETWPVTSDQLMPHDFPPCYTVPSDC